MKFIFIFCWYFLKMNRKKYIGEFVIEKTQKRRGFEGISKGSNGSNKGFEVIEGVILSF